jgi:hypothetical protein
MPEQQIFSGFEDLVKPDTKAKLQAKFIIPPFSVWDTRQGYWQDRKRLWLELGVKSEIGRAGNLTYTGKETTTQHLNYCREKEKAEAEGNGKSFYDSVVAERGGGTSIFDPVVCELCYKWFCPRGGVILDPFAGGSVRGITAHILGYKYIGIDLSAEQIEANKQQGQEIIPDNMPNWISGNSADMYKLLPSGFTCDFVFSCPPYYDLEQYTDHKCDLSNMSWGDFKDEYSDIIYKASQCLEPNRFACFVVSEVRDNKGMYRGLVPFTIAAFKRANMQLYNEIILVNQVGSMPIRVKKQFGDYRKCGRVHQNILVFYNGSKDDGVPRDFNHIETEAPSGSFT